MNIVLVFVGGGIGAATRYWMDGAVQRWTGSAFPLGTFAVNAIGCLLIGFMMGALQDRFMVNPSLRVFLTIGILGGFTTFSTFSYETVTMIRDAEYLFATTNILLTVFTCLGATSIGMFIGKLF